MKRVIVIGSLLLAISLTAVAQIYRTSQGEEQKAFGAVAPSAVFQSTSSMSGSGSAYSANPTIGADGSAYAPGVAAAPKIDRPIRRNPIVDEGDPGNVPLGDGWLPLMLLLGAFAVYKVHSRKNA